MKKEFPNYPQGSCDEIYKSMSKKDKDLIEDFLKDCSITIKTDAKLGKVKRHLIQFYDITEIPLDKQTRDSVNSFLVILNKSNRSVWSKNEMKVYLKKFLKKVYKDLEMIEFIKTENKRGLNPKKINESNLVTEQDVEKMLRFSESYKDKAYLLLLYTTGARPQELIELKWKDINFQDEYADITLFSNKTKQSRTFPVVDKVMKALWDLKQHYPFPDVQPQDYVFSSRYRDKTITTNGLNKMLRRMSKKANLNKDVWNYLLRHTRATRLYEELPTPIVEKLMGHQDQYKTYAHISSKKAREEMLNKIYKLEDLTPQEKEKIKKLGERIKKLEETNKYLMKTNDFFIERELRIKKEALKGLKDKKQKEELTKEIQGIEKHFERTRKKL